MERLARGLLINNGYMLFMALFALAAYATRVRFLRYRRKIAIEANFTSGKRSLSDMTTKEAHDIIAQLQLLEFPYAFNKARKIALLKVQHIFISIFITWGLIIKQAGGIPTMSKLFAVTGQNTRRNAGKRSVDTEVLLRESQSQPRDSERYAMAVARMNYL
jgi:hypothetical protein